MSVAGRKPIVAPLSLAPARAAGNNDSGDDDGGGLFGLGFGPDLGVGGIQTLKDIGTGLTGLARSGYRALNPFDEHSAGGELSQLGWGLANSVGGTIDTLTPINIGSEIVGRGLDAVGLDGAADAVQSFEDKVSVGSIARNVAGLIGGEDAYQHVQSHLGDTQNFIEKAGERGIVSALVEDVGNVALAGAAVTAPVRGAAAASRTGAAGARLTGATNIAQRLTKAADNLTKTHGRLISNPKIRAVQHPYLTAAGHARTNYLKPAAAMVEAADGLTRNNAATQVIDDYVQAEGLEPRIVNPRLRADPEAQTRLADEYMAAPINDASPEVAASYQTLTEHVNNQYKAMEDAGVRVEVVPEAEPYATPEDLFKDIAENKVLKVADSGEDFQHPFFDRDTNNKFRAVHDFIGHSAAEKSFSRHGEEFAWAQHAATLPDEARLALTLETRAQNSALNFSPENVARKAAGEDAVFADQKAYRTADEFLQRDDMFLDPADVERAGRSKAYRAAAKAEKYFEARESRRLVREQSRIAETARRRAARSPAVRGAVVAARQVMEDAGVSRQAASRVVGDEMTLRLTGERAIVDEFVDQVRLTGENITEADVRRIIGHTGEVASDLLDPESLARFNELVDDAVAKQRTAAAENRQILVDSRKGVHGLEGLADDAAMSPEMTKTQTARDRRARKRTKQALGLDEQIRREKGYLKNEIIQERDYISRLGERIQDNLRLQDEAGVRLKRARSLGPQIWKSPGGVQRTAQALYDYTMSELAKNDGQWGGGTYMPHQKRFLEVGVDDGYMVSATQKTVLEVPVDEFTPDHIIKVINAAEDLFDHPDMAIGTWIEDGVVHIDPSQRVETRAEAYALGGARKQEAIFNAATGDAPAIPLRFRPDIAEYFTDPKKSKNYQRIARELDATTEHAGWSEDRILATLDMNMRMAVHAFDKGLVKTPDDFFKNLSYETASRSSTKAGTLNQLVKTFSGGRRDQKRLLKKLQTEVDDLEKALQWYNRSKEGVEKVLRGDGSPNITLFDGTQINAADLSYQLLAATSFNATPRDNFRFTLKALHSLQNPGPGTDATRARIVSALGKLRDGGASLDEVLDEVLPGTKRTERIPEGETGLDRSAGIESGDYPAARRAAMSVLMGNTLDKWTPEFVNEHRAAWGIKEKTFDADRAYAHIERHYPEIIERQTQLVGEQGPDAVRNQAIREYYGSDTYTKIMSFWDNLAHPETSQAVTLDLWMDRLFGGGGFTGQARWADRAEAVRSMARELTDIRRATDAQAAEVLPHQIQAALWVWINKELYDQRVGHFQASMDPAYRALDSGDMANVEAAAVQFIDDMEAPYLGRESGEGRRSYDRQVRRPGRKRSRKETMTYTGSGAADNLESYEKWRGYWDEARPEVQRHLDAGDTQAARKAFDKLYANKVRRSVRGGSSGDANSVDILDHIEDGLAGRGSAAYQKAFDQYFPEPNALPQKFKEELYGQFVPGADAGGTIRLFKSANMATLVHENGHLLRRVIPANEVKAIERHYGVKKGQWTEAAEEAFANDFMQFMATDTPPHGLDLTFADVRRGLSDIFTDVQMSPGAKQISSAVSDLWTEWLDPALRESQIPEGNIAGLTLPDVETGTPGQRVGRVPKLNEHVTKGEAYHAGRRSQRALGDIQKLQKRKDALELNKAHHEKLLTELEDLLENGQTRAEKRQAKYLEEAGRDRARNRAELGTPSIARTPTRWQPMYQALGELRDYAEKMPELEGLLATLPETLPEIQALALEKGFDPTHVRQFTPDQVRRLVWGNLRLGLGRDISEMTAGTRKTRTGQLRRAGAVEDSVEAFIAASAEVTLEARTNETINYIERTVARRLEPGREIPDGWVKWDPVRSHLLTPVEVSEDTLRLVDTGTEAGTTVIPKRLETMLRRESGSYDHSIFNAIGKVTNPWRMLVLTLSPGWYARNFVGNFIMATAEGVSLQDWAKAWKSYRNKDEVGHFADIPFAQGDSLANEAVGRADSSVIPRANVNEPGLLGPVRQFGEGRRTLVNEAQLENAAAGRRLPNARGQLRGTAAMTRDTLQRANAVVDEFSRAAVFHRGKRANMTDVEAWERATNALVDYDNLSPFERQAVRSVIPFYSWQKGILKTTVKQAVDHPARVALLMQTAKMQEEYVADLLGLEDGSQVPDYYLGMLGDTNVTSYNPFADPVSILTPEGIAQSLNPFVETAARKGLGAPSYMWSNDLRLNRLGNPERDIDAPAEIQDLLLSSPAGRVAGGDLSPFSAGLGGQDMERLRERIARSRKIVTPGPSEPESDRVQLNVR